jgi:hypothetical protein
LIWAVPAHPGQFLYRRDNFCFYKNCTTGVEAQARCLCYNKLARHRRDACATGFSLDAGEILDADEVSRHAIESDKQLIATGNFDSSGTAVKGNCQLFKG